MPAIAARRLVASPRLPRPRAMSPVITAATPKGIPISSQQEISATKPKSTEATPSSLRGACGSLGAGLLMWADSSGGPPFVDHPLELTQPRCRSVGPQRRSGLRGQLAGATEQPVQDQRPLDVV